MRRRALTVAIFVAGAALCAPAQARAAGPPVVVAVFEAQADGVDLSAATLQRLTRYVAAKLASTGRFSVIPDREVAALLRQKKADSYRHCYDDSCQIELGKELAAAKTVSIRVIQLGRICALSMVVFDVVTATSDYARTLEGGCTEDDLVVALRIALEAFPAAQVAGSPPPTTRTATAAVTAPSPRPSRPPAGVTSRPPPDAGEGAAAGAPPAADLAEAPAGERAARDRLELFVLGGAVFGVIDTPNEAAGRRFRVLGGPTVVGGARVRLVAPLWLEAHGGAGFWKFRWTDDTGPRESTETIGRFGGSVLARWGWSSGRAGLGLGLGTTVDTGGNAYLHGQLILDLWWLQIAASGGGNLPNGELSAQLLAGARVGVF